jgi:hypothetical protein
LIVVLIGAATAGFLAENWTASRSVAASAVVVAVGLVVLFGWRDRIEALGSRTSSSAVVIKAAPATTAPPEAAQLQGADLRGIDLTAMSLAGATLKGANLSGANLSGDNLAGAYPNGADLRGADLRDTCLQHADFSGAILDGADFTGADVRTAINLKPPASAMPSNWPPAPSSLVKCAR